MSKQFLALVALTSLTITLFGQKKIKLHDKKFSYEIENEKKDGKLGSSSAAYYYTYLGNYQKAIENYSLDLDWGLDSINSSDSIAFAAYQPINAYKYLEEKTADEQIVIISEAHQMPQHRIFTSQLLTSLYANGFRHLGVETLTPNYVDSTKFLMDTLLNIRGYPLNSHTTGFYTREPQMGNMVRQAIEIGFEVFAYERINRDVDRDLQQAINVEKYMGAHPNEKVVIHCGWYHAIESDYPKRETDNWMAYHLKQRTGIDPLTIYQDALSERATTEENSPYYNMIQTDEVSVLQSGDDIFNGFGEKTHFDIFIYHPPTMIINNRPDWIVTSEDGQFVSVEKNRIASDQYPVIVEAIPLREKNSTPVDVVELMNKDDSTELFLKKGEYLIRLTNKLREVEEYEEIVR